MTSLHHVYDYTARDGEFWREELEEWMPERILDAHVHVTDPRLRLQTASEEKRRSYWVCEVLEPQAADSIERCYKMVYPGRNVSLLCFGHPSLEYDIDAMNRYTSAECASRGWLGLAVCRPQWDEETVAQALDMPGIVGLKPYYAMIGPSEETRDRYIESSIFDFLPRHQLGVLDARGGWLTLHVPRADRLGHPDNVREVREIRECYPNIVLVIAHLGRTYTEPHAREGVIPLADDDGLYWDNSAVFNPDVHRLALERIGPERILYGTDNPVFYMRGRRQWQGRTYVNRTDYPFHFNVDREPSDVEAAYTLYMYEALKVIKDTSTALGFGRAEVEALLYGNARRLLDQVVAGKASQDRTSLA